MSTLQGSDTGIGTLGEKSLHAALKKWLARSGDRMEERVDGFIVDILRGRDVIEIQTRNFSALKRKLERLTEFHDVRLVYPVAREKWIVRESPDGSRVLSRRRSPKRGDVFGLFEELVSIPEIAARKTFSLEVLLIVEEEVRRQTGGRRWRRDGWSSHDRRLVEVRERALFAGPEDYAALLPKALSETFTNRDLAGALKRPRWLAEKMTYVLRRMDAIGVVGKEGRATVYRKGPSNPAA